MGIQLSNVSFTAQYAPIMKRATATLSDGTAVVVVPDPNITTQSGADDVTGTFKVRIYKSSDTARTTWALNVTWTPTTAGGSSTVASVMSMVLDSANNMHIVYQATDNSLLYKYLAYSAGTWSTATAVQTIAAANSVTRRYRALDIDVTGSGTTAPVAVIAYESKASAGPSAWIRVHIRNSDGTTWRTAYTEDQATLSGGSVNIYSYSEDVSISWNNTGIVSNIGQLVYYACRIGVNSDRGDTVRELQYNVSTGTDGSATVLGTWPVFNQNVGAPYRRGWIFKTANNLWQIAMTVGLTSPKLQVMRLTHGSYSAPVINSTVPTAMTGLLRASYLGTAQMTADFNPYNYVACSYNDNRVFFAFVSPRVPSFIVAKQYTLSGVVFRYPDSTNVTSNYHDTAARIADSYTSYGSGPIGIYGSGNNRNQAGDFKFNFLVVYGYAGNATNGVINHAQYAGDTFYDAPVIVAPTTVVADDHPVLQAKVQNGALYPNIKGKLEFNLARDSAFTTDLRDILEPDTNYRYFGSTNASTPPAITVSLPLSGTGSQKLYSGSWYMRARVVSDLGQVSAWSAFTRFSVSHPPSALTSSPSPGQLVEYGVGSPTFSWQFSDTESTDSQTAYQLQIVRTDTGATVYDSTKVTSSAQSVAVSISSTYKDVPLQWTVSLWDSDNVQGPFSTPVAFTVGDSPSVALASPTNGSTVTSAAPTVSWSFVGGSTRQQRAFRVYTRTLTVLDTFTRTVASGAGSSDNSIAWSLLGAQPASEYAVNGSAMTHTHNATNTRHKQIIGGSLYDSRQRIKSTISVVATGAPIEHAIMARVLDDNNYYWAGLRYGLSGAMVLFIAKRVAGVETDISTLTLSSTYTAASSWEIRFDVIGTKLQAKAFAASSESEQSYGYGLTATDTALVHAGQHGFTSFVNSGTTNATPITATFDNYVLVDGDVNYANDSGWVSSNITSYTYPSNVFADNSFYQVNVEVQDDGGLLGYTAGGVASQWTHPALGDISVVTDDFGATISWTNVNIDSNFIAWRVYRRYQVPVLSDLDDNNTANTWYLLYETADSAGPYSYKDYLCPLNKSVQYVVVQIAERFGSIIESNITAYSTVTLPSDRYFFIPAVPVGTIASYEAAYVTDDSWVDEVEQQVLHIVGRGRQVQLGDDLGASGTLTIQLRGASARADREFIQRLAGTKVSAIWMKNPFGDVKYIKFGNVGVKPLAGTGQTEMTDLSVPYVEVIAPTLITRSI